MSYGFDEFEPTPEEAALIAERDRLQAELDAAEASEPEEPQVQGAQAASQAIRDAESAVTNARSLDEVTAAIHGLNVAQRAATAPPTEPVKTPSPDAIQAAIAEADREAVSLSDYVERLTRVGR